MAFCCCLPAHAGHYVGPVYNGGSCIDIYDDGSSEEIPYHPLNDGSWGAKAEGGNIENCSGAVTATFTWIPSDPYDFAPQSVIVTETATAYWAAYADTGSGQADNGLGGTVIPNTPNFGGYCSSTRYEIKGGDSFSVTISPSANAMSNGDNSCYVTVKVGASPVTLDVFGTTTRADGSTNILIGQGATGALSGGNFALYQWNIPGQTFASFNIASDESSGSVTPVAADETTKPFPHWFWKKDESVTVTCSAVALDPQGNFIGNVSAQRSVVIWAPYLSMGANVGPCTVGPFNGGDQLHAGGPNGMPPGIHFVGSVGTPDFFRTWGDGVWTFTQLCDLERLETYFPPNTFPDETTTYGNYWLDAQFRYWYGQEWPADSTADHHTEHEAEDSPGIGLLATMDEVSAGDAFLMYLMYQPPNAGEGVQWVPLYVLDWWWRAHISRSTPFSAWTPDPPGSVGATGGSRETHHPTWNNIFRDAP